MRSCLKGAAALLGVLSLGGCPLNDPELAAVDPNDDPAPATSKPTDAADNPGGGWDARINGRVAGDGYQLFELDGCQAGDLVTVAAGDPFFSSNALVVVLLDADNNLLLRRFATPGSPLQHVIRNDTPVLKVGVTTVAGSGADFRYSVSCEPGFEVPAPRPQIVYLNFAGAGSAKVHRRSSLSFPAFDGALIDDAYADATDRIKQVVLSEMQSDYARYNVAILSSDHQPPPAEPHSVVHFGAYDPGLLGLADSVDAYNGTDDQQAIVFVERFGAYASMGLTPEEIAVMIANVASHELGHLLGLYHTRDPDDVMDTTGSAWDLSTAQTFRRAPLHESVFPVGMEDSPGILALSVGVNPDAPPLDTQLATAKMELRYRAVRILADEELKGACGTCLHLNDH